MPRHPKLTYEEHDVLMGKVDFGGVSKRVCLEHVRDVQQGEYVIVHVGFALSKVNEEEAQQVFAFLESMNELEDLQIGRAMTNDQPQMTKNKEQNTNQ